MTFAELLSRSILAAGQSAEIPESDVARANAWILDRLESGDMPVEVGIVLMRFGATILSRDEQFMAQAKKENHENDRTV